MKEFGNSNDFSWRDVDDKLEMVVNGNKVIIDTPNLPLDVIEEVRITANSSQSAVSAFWLSTPITLNIISKGIELILCPVGNDFPTPRVQELFWEEGKIGEQGYQTHEYQKVTYYHPGSERRERAYAYTATKESASRGKMREALIALVMLEENN